MQWKRVRSRHQNLVSGDAGWKIGENYVVVFTEKVFSYLSADEIEKMKAEEERKIATQSRGDIGSLSALDHSDDESIDSQPTR